MLVVMNHVMTHRADLQHDRHGGLPDQRHPRLPDDHTGGALSLR